MEDTGVEIRNVQITDTFLGIEDHGMFIVNLEMRYSDSIFQGYQRILGKETAYVQLRSILLAVGVDSWEKLHGQYCRAAVQDRMIRRVGHIIHDIWTEELNDK